MLQASQLDHFKSDTEPSAKSIFSRLREVRCETPEELQSCQFQATIMGPWEPQVSITHEGTQS